MKVKFSDTTKGILIEIAVDDVTYSERIRASYGQIGMRRNTDTFFFEDNRKPRVDKVAQYISEISEADIVTPAHTDSADLETKLNFFFSLASGGVPTGGTTGQVLAKNSSTDGDATFQNLAPLAFDDASTTSTTKGWTVFQIIAYVVAYVASAISNALVTIWNDRGNYDASLNLYPATGGSGTAGAIKKGNIWTISVTGTLGGLVVEKNDTVRALIDTPGQTDANWAIGQLRNVVEDALVDGVTDKAPSQNIVVDALNGVLSPSQVHLKTQSLASATTMTPSAGGGQLISVTGTNTVNTISAGWVTGNSLVLTIIPKAVFKINNYTIASGNIRTKSGQYITTVVNEPIDFIWDAGVSLWLQKGLLTSEFKQSKNPVFGSDFRDPNNLGEWAYASGGGTGVNASATVGALVAGRLGIVYGNKGTANASNNRSRLGLGSSGGNTDYFSVGGKFGYVYMGVAMVPTLATVSDDFKDLHGWSSSASTAEGTNCVMLKHDSSNANWMVIVKKAGTTTANNISTGIPVVAGQYYDIFMYISADGATLEVYIDDVLVYTLTGTGNIPNGTGEAMGLFAYQLFSVAGTNDRQVYMDKAFYDLRVA